MAVRLGKLKLWFVVHPQFLWISFRLMGSIRSQCQHLHRQRHVHRQRLRIYTRVYHQRHFHRQRRLYHQRHKRQ